MEWHELDAEQAYRWWVNQRLDWPLDRALRVWLAYEAKFDWNPDNMNDQQNYNALFDEVMQLLNDDAEARWHMADREIDRDRDA